MSEHTILNRAHMKFIAEHVQAAEKRRGAIRVDFVGFQLHLWWYLLLASSYDTIWVPGHKVSCYFYVALQCMSQCRLLRRTVFKCDISFPIICVNDISALCGFPGYLSANISFDKLHETYIWTVQDSLTNLTHRDIPRAGCTAHLARTKHNPHCVRARVSWQKGGRHDTASLSPVLQTKPAWSSATQAGKLGRASE